MTGYKLRKYVYCAMFVGLQSAKSSAATADVDLSMRAMPSQKSSSTSLDEDDEALAEPDEGNK